MAKDNLPLNPYPKMASTELFEEAEKRIAALEADLEKQILENSDDRKVMVLQTKQIQELETENAELKLRIDLRD